MISLAEDEAQWLLVRLVTNEVVAELPKLQCAKLEYRIGSMTSTEAVLPWDGIPETWVRTTKPFTSAILLVSGTTVLWGGIIIKRQREAGGPGLTLTLATVEQYLDCVYVNDISISQKSQTEIGGLLVNMTRGHKFTVSTEIGPSKVLRDRQYSSTQNKTVLSALTELSNVINGPEWYSTWRENEDGNYVPVVVIQDQLGRDFTDVTILDETVMSKLSLVEDYSSGYGANRVQAISSGTEEGLASDWMSLDDPDRPVIEHKFSASTSVTQKSTLNQHALQELNELQSGTNTMSFGLSLLRASAVGIDFGLGDTLSYELPDSKEEFPDYWKGTMRVIGYTVSFSGGWEITPMMRPMTGVDLRETSEAYA